MSATDDPQNAIVTVGQSLLVLIVLVVILGAAFNAGVDILDEPGSAAVEPTTGSFVEVGGDLTYSYGIETVATLENALRFDGETAVTSSAPANLTNGSWTVCTTADLGDDTNLDATYNLVAYANSSILLQYDAGNWAVYYDNGTHDGKVSIDAPSPRGTSGLLSSDPFTSVCGRYNATAEQLAVSRDDTVTTGSLTAATTAQNTSWEWVGRQDEVRLFNSSVANDTIAEYAADPIQPQPNTRRAARFMFDEGEGSTTQDYIADVSTSIGNASWDTGVAQPGISSGSDYELERNPLRIKVVSGGYLDSAPVVYVVSGADVWYNLLNTFGGFGTTALTFVALALIVLGASWIRDEWFTGGGR